MSGLNKAGEVADTISILFREDPLAIAALDDFARGFITKTSLADRLECCLRVAIPQATRVVLGPTDEEDEHARNPGAA